MPLVVSLTSDDKVYSDIHISTESQTQFPEQKRLSVISHVNVHKIPLVLVTAGPYDVFSNSPETEHYFRQLLAESHADAGIMAKAGETNYVVFYVHSRELGVKCFCLDFGVVAEAESMESGQSGRTAAVRPENTAVFDRVLSKKASKSVIPRAVSRKDDAMPLALITKDQISSAVNKVLQSGLRLRGLTSVSHTNDKLAIKEIFQMTRTAALFALRKYNYDFNAAASEPKHVVTLGEVQAVVEQLLQAFVDVDP